jgi:hypothetical protein
MMCVVRWRAGIAEAAGGITADVRGRPNKSLAVSGPLASRHSRNSGMCRQALAALAFTRPE